MKKEERIVNKIKLLIRMLGYPRWLHHFGTKKYQLWQHVSAIVCMTALRLSLRRVEKWLKMFGCQTPTYSALCKSRKRIPALLFQRAMNLTVGYPHLCVAIDSTGFSTVNPSYHYVKRIGRKNQ